MGLQQEGESLPEDEVFNLLSSSRRRRVLRRLVREREPVELQRLADEVAARENEKEVDQLTDRERKRVYVSLYQTHVPAMADAGVVDYEPDSGEIVPRAKMSQLQHYLAPGAARSDTRPRLVRHESRRERDNGWRLVNAGLALVGIVALVGVAVTLPPFDPVTTVVTVGLVALGTGAFSLLAARWAHEGRLYGGPPPSSDYGVWVLDDAGRIEENRRVQHTADGTRDENGPGVLSLSAGRTSETRSHDRDER